MEAVDGKAHTKFLSIRQEFSARFLAAMLDEVTLPSDQSVAFRIQFAEKAVAWADALIAAPNRLPVAAKAIPS